MTYATVTGETAPRAGGMAAAGLLQRGAAVGGDGNFGAADVFAHG